MSLQTRLTTVIQAIGADVKALWTAVNGKADSAHNHAASSIVSGTLADARLPARLAAQLAATILADANVAQTGWAYGSPSTANRPSNTYGYVLTFALDADSRMQEWWEYSNGLARWVREKVGTGAWGAWKRVRVTEEDLQGIFFTGAQSDARYPVLTSGRVRDDQMPARLGINAKEITDWNLANEFGSYMGDGALNAPGAGWWIGTVLAHNQSPGWCIQTLYPFTQAGLQTGSSPNIWRRVRQNGTWGGWYRIDMSKNEIDGLYATRMYGGNEIVSSVLGTTGFVTVNCAAGSVFTLTPSGSVTLQMSNPPSAGSAATITIIINQGSNARNINMPSGSTWLGSAPAQVANKKCVITMMTYDGGGTWICSGAVES